MRHKLAASDNPTSPEKARPPTSLTGVEHTFGDDEIIVSKIDLKGIITTRRKVEALGPGYQPVEEVWHGLAARVSTGWKPVPHMRVSLFQRSAMPAPTRRWHDLSDHRHADT